VTRAGVGCAHGPRLLDAPSRGGAGGAGSDPTDDETYLRGAQVTDADGIVEFKTIYPGYYPGRTVHIHAKVHLDRSTLLTTQFLFDDSVSDRVFSAAPYAAADQRRIRNDGDGIYDRSLELTLSDEGDGMLGLITLDVQRT
jgi:protocatechuate 3,4-dioxygenase beta subunit